MVRTNTAILPGADAAVVRIKETRRALAMTLDGNGRYCAANPREGAKLIVAEAARNVVCVGARPIAITNCLNFASPERPEVMWSFSEVIDGMAEACRAFETPVVSGNVSFYNETEGRGILPTPVIGMVGLIEDVRRAVSPGFKKDRRRDRAARHDAGRSVDERVRGEYRGVTTAEIAASEKCLSSIWNANWRCKKLVSPRPKQDCCFRRTIVPMADWQSRLRSCVSRRSDATRLARKSISKASTWSNSAALQ